MVQILQKPQKKPVTAKKPAQTQNKLGKQA
jgi:hypothetical protein